MAALRSVILIVAAILVTPLLSLDASIFNAATNIGNMDSMGPVELIMGAMTQKFLCSSEDLKDVKMLQEFIEELTEFEDMESNNSTVVDNFVCKEFEVKKAEGCIASIRFGSAKDLLPTINKNVAQSQNIMGSLLGLMTPIITNPCLCASTFDIREDCSFLMKELQKLIINIC